MNTNDLRYIKTEDLIMDAFISCAHEYKLDDIHIKDICTRARISRNAFYGHYENKYQLMDSVFDRVRQNILDQLTPVLVHNLSMNVTHGITDWCIDAVYENRDVLLSLSHCSKEKFYELIRDVFIDATLDSIYENTQEIENDILLKMSKEFITTSLSAVILLWIENTDCLSKEEFTSFVYEITMQPIAYFYNRLDRSGVIRRRRSL